MGWEGMECIYVVQYRNKLLAVVNIVMNLLVPYNGDNILTR
jgi:hypothetical protein